MEFKYSHFHGNNGTLIGTVAYVREGDKVSYQITKVSPKCDKPTRAEGRISATKSNRTAVVNYDFFCREIAKNTRKKPLLPSLLGNPEIERFMMLWMIATGKVLSPKEIKGMVKR